MITTPVVMTKRGRNLYTALFIAGNGGAWNDWYILKKRADSDSEAIQWFEKTVIGKWGKSVDSVSALQMLGWDTRSHNSPDLAGQDYCSYKERSFIVDGGFQIFLGCQKGDIKGAELRYNVGTRNSQEWVEDFIEFNCDITLQISFGAGISSKESIYLDLRGIKADKVWSREYIGNGQGYKPVQKL